MAEDDRHRLESVLKQHLATLGHGNVELMGHEVMAGGASGARAFRLRCREGVLFLKVVAAVAPSGLVERARREIMFHRELASDLPIRVPEMIASRCERDEPALLLLEGLDPVEWSDARHLEAARILGQLHARFWGKERELTAMPWLRRADEPEGTGIPDAIRAWQRLRADAAAHRLLSEERYRGIIAMLHALDGDCIDEPSMPVTLVHGDFHAGNILSDADDNLVVVDWQEARLGQGPEDLSFYLQRAAFPVDLGIPEDRMIAEYRRSLVEGLGYDVPERDIRRVMAAAELRTRLLHWPTFLIGATEPQLEHHLARIERCAATLGLALTSRS